MSEPKNFLTRWSRRKLDSVGQQDAVAQGENTPPQSPRPETENLPAATESVAAAAQFDPATLPPIESIGADTDLLPFLQAGVPPALTRAALRRAWTADPAIRDFIGLSENAWDFNAPNGVPGFGTLATEEIRRLASRFFAENSDSLGPAKDSHSDPDCALSAEIPSEREESKLDRRHESDDAVPGPLRNSQLEKEENRDKNNDVISAAAMRQDVAVRHDGDKNDSDATAPRYRHGGALPK